MPLPWFLRSKENIEEKKPRETPDGLWIKCDSCGEALYKGQLEENLWVCFKCGRHFRIGFKEYVKILFDEDSFVETHSKIRSTDMLEFFDTKSYKDRIEAGHSKTGLNDAISVGHGAIDDRQVSFGCMNFKFIGGSMGSVVGEKFYRAAKFAIDKKIPLVVISATGGARMQEAALSLMQMAKTSVALAELAEEKLPYFSILTDPSTGGVSASFGMLGDVNIAEPGALIGFAGPRVIEQTINRKLPPGFQRSEFLLEKGFVDMICKRKELRPTLVKLIDWFKK